MREYPTFEHLSRSVVDNLHPDNHIKATTIGIRLISFDVCCATLGS